MSAGGSDTAQVGARIGIVTGLVAEARIAAGWGEAVAGGGGPDGAAAAAERLVGQGVRRLISFGLAGGLNPARRPGELIEPAWVMMDGRRLATSGGTGGLLAGVRIAATQAEKQALFAASGAEAIDMESGAVALVALRHGIPFQVVRAICDPADRDLPPAALVTLDAGGAIGGLRLLASLLRHPGQLSGLFRLAGDARAARVALQRRVRAPP